MIRLPDDFLEPTDEDKEMSEIWKELRENMEQTIETILLKINEQNH